MLPYDPTVEVQASSSGRRLDISISQPNQMQMCARGGDDTEAIRLDENSNHLRN